MKFVKFSVLALALGVFATSCTNSTEENTTTEGDTTMVTPMVEPVAPAAEPMPMDTAAAPMMMDTASTTPAAPAEMK